MTDDLKRAEAMKRWLDKEPERAVQILAAGLAMLAVHGYQPSEGEPLVWVKGEPLGGQG